MQHALSDMARHGRYARSECTQCCYCSRPPTRSTVESRLGGFQPGEPDLSERPLPRELCVRNLGSNRYQVQHPDSEPEGRDVVFGGQLLAQAIMASDDVVAVGKTTQSIHTIFSRVGTYASPVDLEVEVVHDGRTFASHTTTATQAGRSLARAMLLLTREEPDLIHHGPTMPDVPNPSDLEPAEALVFPGVDTRPIPSAGSESAGGSPTASFWMRHSTAVSSVAANQAILAWSQPGGLIGLAMSPHAEVVNLRDAHRTVSTGVVAHTARFHEPFDVADWLLVVQEATYAGRGRVFGVGSVFGRGGELVSTFSQESMVRSPNAPLKGTDAM
jgi:acyl-CoA thioesterase-2